jgi:hypothetical protein
MILLHGLRQTFLWDRLGDDPGTQIEPALDCGGAGKEVTDGKQGLVGRILAIAEG